MGVVDLILNLAGLLLWLNWRAEKTDPVSQRKPATLIGTLRRADGGAGQWQLPAFILGLLVLRALLYWQIGSALRWSAKLDLGVVVLSFPIPSNAWFSCGQMVLFSICGFALTLGFYYMALLLLSILDGPEPFRTFVRLQLGAADRWAKLSRLFLPFIAVTALWWVLTWLLVSMQIIPPPAGEGHRIAKAITVGLGSYLAWKYVAIVLLLLHLSNSYIYFGKHPFWNFINAEAQKLLAPLRSLPLRFKRIDLTPLVAILVVAVASMLVEKLLWMLYRRLDS